MSQEINNQDQVGKQLNIKENKGALYWVNVSRFSKRFEKLNEEVKNDIRYDGVITELDHYLTKLDGINTETKLKDGGYTEKQIIEALRRKENYAKKLEKTKFFESSQWINSQLFAKIKMDFETHIEPMIIKKEKPEKIRKQLIKEIIDPILELINKEGEKDEVLNFNADDILGMVYYLTGKCHLNWIDYDNL